MKNLLIVIFLFSILKCYGQSTLELVDSVTLSTQADSTYLLDVYYLDHKLIAIFVHYSFDSTYIYLTSNKGDEECFKYGGTIHFEGASKLFKSSTGYVLPKYYRGFLIFFHEDDDKLSIDYNLDRKTVFRPGFLQKKHYPMPHNYYWMQNSAYYHDSTAIFHCGIIKPINLSIKNYSKLARQFSKINKNRKVLMKFDLRMDKTSEPFGYFPSFYTDSIAYYIVNSRVFSTFSNDNAYISFQADSRIYRYNHHGEAEVVKDFPKNQIRKTKLLLYPPSLGHFKFQEYYNALCDSYGELYLFDDVLFRKYNLALNSVKISEYSLPDNFEGCITRDLYLGWTGNLYHKPAILQQIDWDSNNSKEYYFPHGMNIFVGYDKEKGLYYFRKWTTPTVTNSANIYVYKASYH